MTEASRVRVAALILSMAGAPGLGAQAVEPSATAADTQVAVGTRARDDTFWRIYARLQAGTPHAADVPTGRIERTRVGAGGRIYRYVVIVPDDYDPARRYPAAFYLHGGVSRPDPGPGGTWWRRYENVTGHDRIAVLPLAWDESMWWQADQVENLHAILSDVKRAYNVDENRVYVFGVSDGGTGAYFLAFKDATPWAAFLPFIGDPAVLANPATGVDGRMNMANLVNRPFFIVNNESDPLYPARVIAPYVARFQQLGADVTFTTKPGGHDTRWWPEEDERIERWVAAHVREPHPDSVLWATERTDRYNRVHWMVIDELGPVPGDESRGPEVATSDGSSGIVDAARSGNSVTVVTYHVRRFTLLVSPEAFDVARPIRVVANGRVVFDDLVSPSVETLAKWAAVDEDRTMLYAAEIHVEVPGG